MALGVDLLHRIQFHEGIKSSASIWCGWPAWRASLNCRIP